MIICPYIPLQHHHRLLQAMGNKGSSQLHSTANMSVSMKNGLGPHLLRSSLNKLITREGWRSDSIGLSDFSLGGFTSTDWLHYVADSQVSTMSSWTKALFCKTEEKCKECPGPLLQPKLKQQSIFAPKPKANRGHYSQVFSQPHF